MATKIVIYKLTAQNCNSVPVELFYFELLKWKLSVSASGR